MSFIEGYEILENPPMDQAEKKACENNAKDRNAILCGSSNSEFLKVLKCKNAKDVWEKLYTIYEGDDKVKEAKLQTHRAYFKSIKMKEDESITTLLLWVDEVINSIRGLSEELKEKMVVKKVLRSLPIRFDSKVFFY